MNKNKNAQCEFCGRDFVQKHKNHKYCNKTCKSRYYSKITEIEYNCDCCDKKYIANHKKHGENNFCSKDCEVLFRHNLGYKDIKCEICNREMHIKKSSKSTMCSIECQNIWQSINRSGENAPSYDKSISLEDRTIICKNCNKSFIVGKYRIDKTKYCSSKCRVDYLRENTFQTEEHKEQSRLRMVNILSTGLMNTDTKPQLIVNDILNNLNVKFNNEENFKYYTIDNYLSEYNLAIEVMGGFWHCDRRLYNEPKYERQKIRIRGDKAKRTYLKNNHNINILYLWEIEIMENPKLCIELVKRYVDLKGELENYHSFNYYIDKNNLLTKQEIEIPFMEIN